MRRLPLLLLASALLVLPAAEAGAAPLRCDKTRGTELARNTVVKVYKVKVGSSFRFFGCARPRGPVVALTQPFTGNAVRLRAVKGAYVAFSRTVGGLDTLSVVDARTGRKRQGLFPPESIEFDIDPQTPQIGAVRVNTKGELAVAYIGLGTAGSTGSTTFVYGFDRFGSEEEFDSGPLAVLKPSSVRLVGSVVSWVKSGVRKSAPIT